MWENGPWEVPRERWENGPRGPVAEPEWASAAQQTCVSRSVRRDPRGAGGTAERPGPVRREPA